MHERSLSIRQKTFGPNHPAVAESLNNLAISYQERGDLAKALQLYSRSLAIYEAVFGPDHPNVADTLGNLAEVYRAQGDHAKAFPLCERGLAIRQRAFGRENLSVARSLNNLAALYCEVRDYSKALDLYHQSLGIMEKILGREHPEVAICLLNLASLYGDQGNSSLALPLLQRSLTIREKTLGCSHPQTTRTMESLATLCLRLGDWDRGLALFSEKFKRQRAYFGLEFSATPSGEAGRTIQRHFAETEYFHAVCAAGLARGLPASQIYGAEQLALNKALLEEVETTKAALETDQRTTTQELREEYQAIQVQLMRLPERPGDLVQREATRQRLQSELTGIAAKISERIALVGQAIAERNLSLSNLASALPADAAFIDLIQYRGFDFTTKAGEWKALRYAAYLTFPLARDSTNLVVERVDLGEAAPVNEAVEFVCKRMSSGTGYAREDVSAALQRLGELVYAPLARHLTNVSHLIICPDGQLSRVPFEMLRVGDRFLIEEKTISYVTSGREIVRLEGSLKSRVQSLKSLVMGGPDFDLDLSKAGSASFQLAGAAGIPARSSAEGKQDALPLAGRMPALRSLSRDYRGITFKPLPGAEAEARSVAALLGGDCVLRLGAEAREAELKAAVSPRVLHLATHGFFLSDQEFRRTNALRDSWIGNSGTRWNASLPKDDWENPLVRCGIALAGANHAGQITNAVAEDGLLTGLEASLLNLQGTELVILSACDSGTGEVKIGEGVMSLRRAFRIAGAQTVLASHWKVNDKATSQLMTEFIRRWRSGEPRAKAWREAQLSLLHSKEFASPYFWAAFTLTGQWN